MNETLIGSFFFFVEVLLNSMRQSIPINLLCDCTGNLSNQTDIILAVMIGIGFVHGYNGML